MLRSYPAISHAAGCGGFRHDVAVITYRSDVRGINAERLGGFFEGWPSTPTPDTLLRVLGRSSQVALALEGDEVVGFAYAISDGLLAAHVPLLEVRASHRGR
jgi:hypothetical protein